MAEIVYQELTRAECLHVLRQAHVTRAAFCNGERPYIVPMCFHLEAQGDVPLIFLCMPDHGRKAEYLSRCSRVCLEFESPGTACADVVLLEGSAVPAAWVQNEGLAVYVRGEEISGRRFFMPE